MKADRSNFDRSSEQIRDVFRGADHFVGDSCSQCKKTANVVSPRAGWLCVCGGYNTLSWSGDGMRPHERLDLGPTRSAIQQAAASVPISERCAPGVRLPRGR